jgi:hypothetical protein
MVPYHVLVENLADCHNLLVDMVHLEVLVNAKMDLNFFDRVDSLVKNVLGFIDFSKSTLTDHAYLFEKSLVSILLQILAELVIICLLFVPENDLLMDVFASWLVLFDPDKVNHWLSVHVNLYPRCFLLGLIFLSVVSCLCSGHTFIIGLIHLNSF